jgi:glyoxylase-like metal-dependent hydrolase (beta-lactamase superfamily II)
MRTLANGVSWVDLEFLGRPHAIATGVVQGAGGVALIDPGPSSCLATLERRLGASGIRLADVTHILLTHIHLDHAGSTGTIARRHPHVRVYVHERGAPHLADPAKLIASATRLYGDRMDYLWGAIEAVPPDRMVALAGGERIDAGGRAFDVAYTPGHAVHHVTFLDASSGVAFVGDTAGVCIDGGWVLPPTPPPDINLEAWRGSVERIEAWEPSTLFLTHFGPAPSVRPHLRALIDHLELTAGMVKAALDAPGSDEEKAARFGASLRRELRAHMTEAQVDSYPIAAPFEQLWAGLARYWRKQAEAPAR